jgi:dGTPase
MDQVTDSEALQNKIDALNAPKLTEREHGEKNPERAKGRTPFQRDYARILYSSSFRRLQGKMQFLGVDPANFYRNRLTHSLEVAQIARSICHTLKDSKEKEFWKPDEITLIEALCLAHDMGNPPFGHAGERILNELADDIGGFEGNAQTLRIVRTLERKYPDVSGLNLTWRAIFGLVKHFHTREECEDKFLYSEDYAFVKGMQDTLHIKQLPTVDCAVMDTADLIAYAVHDLEDALHLQLISIDELEYLFVNVRQRDNLKLLKGVVKNSKDMGPSIKKLYELLRSAKNYTKKYLGPNSSDVYRTILYKTITSKLANEFVSNVGIINKENEVTIGLTTLQPLAEGLKKLLFNTLKIGPDILQYERVGEKVLRELYKVFMDRHFNDKNVLLSHPYCYEKDRPHDQPKRLIIDYLAGMTDQFALEEYRRFTGKDAYEGIYFKKE